MNYCRSITFTVLQSPSSSSIFVYFQSKAALMKDLSSSIALPSGAVDQAVSDSRHKVMKTNGRADGGGGGGGGR